MGYYESVDRQLEKLGLLDLDKKAYTITVDRPTARRWVRRIIDPNFPVFFEDISPTWGAHVRLDGGSDKDHIIFNSAMIDNGTLKLGTVLHECAHHFQKPGSPSHGIEFTRLYAKLLKTHVRP